MNDLDLREHFEEWAAPLRAAPAPGVEQLKRRARHRSARRLTIVTSAVAMAALAGVLFVGLKAPGYVTPTPYARNYQPPNPFVQDRYTAPRVAPFGVVYGRGGQSVRVIDAASGLTQFSGTPLGGDGSVFTTIAAAPSDRLFILAQQSRQVRTSFDILRIGMGTKPLTAIMPGVSLPPGDQIYAMTVNPQGTRLALNTVGAGGAGPFRLLVYNVASGALLANFTEREGIVRYLQYWPSEYSLAFTWLPGSHGASGSGLRTLAVAAPAPGNSSAALLADSRAAPSVHGYRDGAFTADGTVAITQTETPNAMRLAEYSTRTGRLLHLITFGTPRPNVQSANYCGLLWASTDGTDLLTQCGNLQLEVVNGKTTRVRLAVTVPASQVGWADTFGW
jgi:hypothetical protein